MNRFYKHFDPFLWEPRPEEFEVVEGSTGREVKSKISLKEGEPVFCVKGLAVPKPNKYTLKCREEHLLDMDFTQNISHMCSPNMTPIPLEKVGEYPVVLFTAMQDIVPGNIIGFDYEDYEEEITNPFNCKCGSDNCRGIIGK